MRIGWSTKFWFPISCTRYAAKRVALKKASVNPALPPTERKAAMAALHALPRDASPGPSG